MSESSRGHHESTPDERPPLGRMIVDRGLATQQQVDEALAAQQTNGRRLGQVLCQMGYVDSTAVLECLVEQAGVERVDPETCTIAPEAAGLVPADLAMRHKVLALATDNGCLRVAMADPFDHAAAEDLRLLTGRRIRRCYCPEPALMAAVRKHYGSSVARMVADLGGKAEAERSDSQAPESVLELQELASEPTVVNLVNLILYEAVEARASDVHIEPFEKQLRLKYRIDGVLREMPPPARHLHAAIVSRIKIMAGMNIAERFVPQDGHIALNTPHGKIDLRVGTVPTVFGECVAMRILDRSAALLRLTELGMSDADEAQFQQMLRKPHGIVLVTGPTGSGKTTSLYAAINHIYSPQIKLITIEDPVEYQLDGINQIPVNRKRGVDFANGLRAILRQDPDVIMIGETRDRETADIAIRSALTGHLVFSTLHTNDAPGAVTRLLDMGVEPYLLASSLEGVIAQRLVRRTCPKCRRPHVPEVEVLRRLGHRRGDAESGQFFRGAGCRHCRETGYHGRTGIFEVLAITENIRKVILQRGSGADILAAAPVGHRPMREDGFRKAAAGETTLDEVLRVTQDTPAEEALRS